MVARDDAGELGRPRRSRTRFGERNRTTKRKIHGRQGPQVLMLALRPVGVFGTARDAHDGRRAEDRYVMERAVPEGGHLPRELRPRPFNLHPQRRGIGIESVHEGQSLRSKAP